MNKLQVTTKRIALQILKRVRKVHPEVKNVTFEVRHASYGSSNAVVLWDGNENIVDSRHNFKTDNPRVMADCMIRSMNAMKKATEV